MIQSHLCLSRALVFLRQAHDHVRSTCVCFTCPRVLFMCWFQCGRKRREAKFSYPQDFIPSLSRTATTRRRGKSVSIGKNLMQFL